MTSKRKGHEYKYFVCSHKCDIGSIRMEKIDNAALEYLSELMSEENQQRIADALRSYQANDGNRMQEFKAALQVRVDEKKGQYDALLKNL